jgi:maltose O-acetyltransferase
MAELLKFLALVLYYAFARWLPPSNVPGGAVFKRIRGMLAKACFAHTGENVNIQYGCYFGTGAGISLGDRSSLGIRAELHGPVIIGKNVMMGPETLIHTRNHRISDHSRPMIDQGYGPIKPVRIGDDVWIGARVVMLPGVTIGSGSVIGAASVVNRDIPDNVVAAGNPCVVIRPR